MKKNFLILILLILFLMTGCSNKGKPNNTIGNEGNTPNLNGEKLEPISYDKYIVNSYIKDHIKPNMEVYRLVFDAVDNYENTVDVSKYNLNEEDVSKISIAIYDRLEFQFISSITLNKNNEIKIEYSKGKDEFIDARDKFREASINLLENIVKQEYSSTEKVLALYQYISNTTNYDEEAKDVGAYGVMVNHEGICTGYAYSIQYILEQLGIKNELASSSDKSHIWNIVELDGKWYHLDATWESSNSDKDVNTLDYFGMDDKTRKENSGFESWTSGNENFKSYESPTCTDEKFSEIHPSYDVEVNYDKNEIQYKNYDKPEERKVFKY